MIPFNKPRKADNKQRSDANDRHRSTLRIQRKNKHQPEKKKPLLLRISVTGGPAALRNANLWKFALLPYYTLK
jgi:hypothetical protein